jgi:adenylate kinase family enzyme
MNNVEQKNEKYLILIRGLSGSGKRTLAELIIANEEKRTAISSDDFFFDENDNYTFVKEQIHEAHDWCKQETTSCAEQKYEIIVVHNVFSKAWELEPYFEIALKYDYRLKVINLFDAGLNDHELAKRSEANVPIYTIKSQRAKFQQNPFRTHDTHRRRPYYKKSKR